MIEIYKGIGLGLAALLGAVGVYFYRKQLIANNKARLFDIEVLEKEAHEKIDSMDPDSLVDNANKWAGKPDSGNGH